MEKGYSSNIVMISPYRYLSRSTSRIASEMNFSIEIVEEVLEEGVKAARELERKGVECIISRGATGIFIKNNVSVPVVLVQITAFDILTALYEAREMGKKIIFFEHVKRKNHYDFEEILKLLGNPGGIDIFYYSDRETLVSQVEKAAENQADVVVSTGECTLQIAREKGIPQGIMVQSSREALVEAFQRAHDIVDIRQKERKAAGFMNTVIDNVDTGILVVNDSMEVTHYNPVSEKLLGSNRERVIGQPVHDIPDLNSSLKDILKMEMESASKMLDMGDKKIYASRVPLIMNENKKNRLFGVMMTLQEVGKIQKMEAQIRKELYSRGLVARFKFEDVIFKSQAMEEVVNRGRRYARTDSTVLVMGESGTGKELFAHSIHQESPRDQGPFVAVNCATIPENLLESELFGYSEGAFTGAKKGGKPGLFELAHGGTIFLDEISEIPLNLQARLLRVLQEKSVRRVGDDKIIPVDVRIIAATNRDLLKLVKEGYFRQDLYFRLNVLSLNIPPLRRRKEDIFLLIRHYLKNTSFPDNFIEVFQTHCNWLEQYHWPGNARELENFVEKFVSLNVENTDPYRVLQELVEELFSYGNEYLSGEELDPGLNKLVIDMGTMEEMEKEIIKKVQKMYPSESKSTLARKLNLSRTTLWKKMKSSLDGASGEG